MFVSCVHPVAVLNAAFLQFVNAGRRCKRRPYRRGILQSRSHDCLEVAMSVSFCLPHPAAVSAFIICRDML